MTWKKDKPARLLALMIVIMFMTGGITLMPITAEGIAEESSISADIWPIVAPESIPLPSVKADPFLQAYWPFEEGAGVIAEDITWNGNNGTLMGDSVRGPGISGDCMNFDGSGDFLSMGTIMDMGTDNMTIELWYNKTTASLVLNDLITKGRTGFGTPANAGYDIHITNNRIKFRTGDGGNDYTCEAPEPSVNEWHYVVGVLDRVTPELRLYIDGVKVNTTAITTLNSLNNNVNFALGAMDRRPPNGLIDSYLNGKLDEVKIWNKSFNDTEIADRYAAATAIGIDYIEMITDPANGSSLAPANFTTNTWFNITTYAGAYNNTVGFLGIVDANWTMTNYSGANASWSNATGNTSDFFGGGLAGVALAQCEYMGLIDLVNATLDNYMADIEIEGIGGEEVQNPPTTQVIFQNMLPGDSISIDIMVENNGYLNDTMQLIWNPTLASGVTAEMTFHGNNTDITPYLNVGPVVLGFYEPDQGDNLTLWVNASENVAYVAGLLASIQLGLFSIGDGEQDSAGVVALQVQPLDSMILTDSPNGTPLANEAIANGGAITAFASGYNATGTYVGLVESNWTLIPDLGTFNDTFGYSTQFTSNGTAGWTNITGQNLTASVEDAFDLYVSETTPPVTNFTAGDPNFVSGNITYVNETTSLNLTATDAGSGVASTWFRVWNGTWTAWMLDDGTNGTIGEEGLHYVEFNSTDNDGNHEVTQNVTLYGDFEAPITARWLTGASYGTSSTYIMPTTQINLAGNDGNGSGCPNTFYRIDGGAWIVGNGTLTFTIATAGAHQIDYRSVDNLGQNESIKTFDVFVDGTAPVTTFATGNPYFNGSLYINESTAINLTASDIGAGVDGILYSLDGGTTWTLYSGNFTIPAEGDYVLEYYSTDWLGQAETTKSVNLTVDNSPGSVLLTLSLPNQSGTVLYITSTTNLNLTAIDSGSGVAAIRYGIDGSDLLYTSDFTITSPGAHTISIWMIDNLGQASTKNLVSLFVDDIAPVTTTTPAGTSGTLDVNASTTVSLTSADAGCGVESTMYSIDAGVTWTQYTVAIPVSANTTIQYYAVDNLGNQEATKTLVVTITPVVDTPAADDSFISEYWWILLIFLAIALLLAFLLLGKKKAKCDHCGKTSDDPEGAGWMKHHQGNWVCAECTQEGMATAPEEIEEPEGLADEEIEDSEVIEDNIDEPDIEDV